MGFFAHLVLTVAVVTLAVLAASKLMPDVRVGRMKTALGVAALFGVLNLLLGWLIKAVVALALLPAAVVTFGLAFLLLGFLVNCVLLWMTDKFIKDFEISSFRGLFGTALLVGVAQWVLHHLA